MRYVMLAILALLILLSLLAGGAKTLEMPQEIEFFTDAGVSPVWLIPVGVLQIAGGLLAIYPGTKLAGAAIMALGFLISSIIIFMTGNSGFAIFSLLPALLACLVIWQSRSTAEPGK